MRIGPISRHPAEAAPCRADADCGHPACAHRGTTPGVLAGGAHTRAVVDNWAQRPVGWSLGDVVGVAVSADDEVFVFTRGPRPVLVFDREGRFLRWWGDTYFTMPHGIAVAPDGSVCCADIADHTVKRFSPSGELLQLLGAPFENSPKLGGAPFNRPTHFSVAPNGDYYITDGYGNANVHVFSPEGAHRFSWGSPGSDPGQFRAPHSIVFDGDGRLAVCDRGNDRIQFFDLEGTFLEEWTGLHQPNDLVFAPDGRVFICEFEHRLGVWSAEGALLQRWGDDGEGLGAGQFISPHGLAIDSQGSLYVGDVTDIYRGIDRGSRNLQKLVPVTQEGEG